MSVWHVAMLYLNGAEMGHASRVESLENTSIHLRFLGELSGIVRDIDTESRLLTSTDAVRVVCYIDPIYLLSLNQLRCGLHRGSVVITQAVKKV
jgi:hypothetical protein